LNVYIHAPMHMHFSDTEYCSHTEHISVIISAPGTPDHKKFNTDFVFPWCKLKVAQSHSVLNSNSRTNTVSKCKTISVVTCHITSNSVATSWWFISFHWAPGKSTEILEYLSGKGVLKISTHKLKAL
jgi:hypothetical protein